MDSMTEQRRGYVAYLLRLWQVQSEGEIVWRASLESAQTGKCQGFANLTDLFTFLESEVCHSAQDQPTPSMGREGGDIDD
jgi:hypothetical protein